MSTASSPSNTNNKTRTIAYWALTGLVALGFALGGVVDLMGSPQMVEGMAHLGYPAYFVTILGTWKVLGAIAILVPKFPRLKEWAYAGMLFDLSGAAISHGSSGDNAAKIMTPLILLALAFGSWALRPASRKLASPEVETARASSARTPALAT